MGSLLAAHRLLGVGGLLMLCIPLLLAVDRGNLASCGSRRRERANKLCGGCQPGPSLPAMICSLAMQSSLNMKSWAEEEEETL